MKLEIIDGPTVRKRLPMKDCVEAMVTAMTAVTKGTVKVPQRIVMPLVDRSGYFALMPGSASEPSTYGAKLVTLYPDNAARGRPVVQGFVALFDHHTGAPVALIDGAAITALRTGAVSALATRELARAHTRTLGLLGCGVQASAHLEAICTVRDIAEVIVWGRSFEKARAFAEQNAGCVTAQIRAVGSPEEAARCDIVCAVTNASEPILRGTWLQPGSHVNLVGAYTPTTREADTALIASGRLYVDSLASAFSEAGDILIPIQEGAITRSHVIGELGALLLGIVQGRRSADEITIYKSVGLFVQDLIAAHAVYTRRPANE